MASTCNSLVTIFDINLFSSSEWINNPLGLQEPMRKSLK